MWSNVNLFFLNRTIVQCINIEVVFQKLMPSIKICIDSGSDIPPELAEEYDIAVIPLYVFFKDDKGIEQVFMDRVELTGEDFYDKLVNFKNHPSTAQPSPNDILELFKKFEEEYDDIIFISLSSELSGTYSSAHIAQKMINQSKKHHQYNLEL